MDFDAIASVSGVTRLTTPPRVVTAVNAVDSDANIKRREPDQVERIVEQEIFLANPFRGVSCGRFGLTTSQSLGDLGRRVAEKPIEDRNVSHLTSRAPFFFTV